MYSGIDMFKTLYSESLELKHSSVAEVKCMYCHSIILAAFCSDNGQTALWCMQCQLKYLYGGWTDLNLLDLVDVSCGMFHLWYRNSLYKKIQVTVIYYMFKNVLWTAFVVKFCIFTQCGSNCMI